MFIEQKIQRARELFEHFQELTRAAYSPDEKQLAGNHIRRLTEDLEVRIEWLELGLKGLKDKEQGL